MDMKPPTVLPQSKGRWKVKQHPACLPIFVKYEHYTKAFLEGHDFFQNGEGSEERMDWLCGRMRNKIKCTAQLTISADGKFSRLRAHNHKPTSQGLVETTSWASYRKSLAEVFARRCEKKKKGDRMYHEGQEYVCKSSGKGRCYWSCVEHSTDVKCNARIATWYDGVIVKVTGQVHNHKPPELTPAQRVQQEYDEWFPKQWAGRTPFDPYFIINSIFCPWSVSARSFHTDR
jgi:FLYWCH zinc finger domain